MALYVWAGIILAVGAFLLWLYMAGRSAGKDAIAADVAEEAATNLRKQDAAGAEAQGRDVMDRLRKGGF